MVLPASNISPDTGITRTLAKYLVAARAADLPQEVREHAVRTFTNWKGCAVGAARHDEAKRGWANVTSTHRNYEEITSGLGERHESLLNTFKPFACGIVIHPAIDGCIQLRNEHNLRAQEVASVLLKVHRARSEVTGRMLEPRVAR